MDNSFLHTKRLLLVDDEQELLKMVSDILKDAGFETVLTAMTVKEAILTAKEETPDLIVLDVMLPDGDGFSLMQHFRTFTNVPIIFLTAKDEAADKLSGLGLGADDYISKPFMPQELFPCFVVPSFGFSTFLENCNTLYVFFDMISYNVRIDFIIVCHGMSAE